MKARIHSILNFLGWCVLLLILSSVGASLYLYDQFTRYEARASAFDLTRIDRLPERSAVFDSNGDQYSFFGGENRLIIPIGSISKHFIAALLTREDTRFWDHEGIDPKGIARAFFKNLRAGDTREGASTITQQLARNACELRARTLDRKILEAVLARQLEAIYTKEQILELYCNRIYFGSGFYGIEAASRGYFGKPASELNLSEAAVLAALVRSPNRLSPFRDATAATEARNGLLDRMLELNSITPSQAATAKALKLNVLGDRTLRLADDYVTDAVLRELNEILSPDVLDLGGLKVFMTIDPAMQNLAQTVANRRLRVIEEQKHFGHPKMRDFVPALGSEGDEKETDYLQTAIVVIDNRSGAIRAIVGGRDYEQSKYPRALLSRRQIGSTFKPFVYAAAFERGLLPGTLIDDSKIFPGEFRNISNNWSPENSDNDYAGLQPAGWGLLKSRNTMSIRVGEYAGLGKVRQLARLAGIGDSMPEVPSAFLGAFETTLKDLTAAYTIFPNAGVLRPVHLIERIENRDGRAIWTAPESAKRVLQADTAWMVSTLLQHVMISGTAAKAGSLGWKKPGGGKTGTTNDFFDAWFVGYTTTLTCGVWVGMDRPQTIQEKGYGSALALPIWVDLMQQVPEQKYPAQRFVVPSDLIRTRLCSASGGRATSACEENRTAYDCSLPSGRVPPKPCPIHPELTASTLSSAPQVVAPQIALGNRAPYPGTAQPTPQLPNPALRQPPAPAPTGAAPPDGTGLQPGNVRVERTASGLRITHLRPGREANVPEVVESAPSQPIRVLRAIPVEQSSRSAMRIGR